MISFLNELHSLLFRVRELSQKMGYGQGHMEMGLAEKKGLFTCFIYQCLSCILTVITLHRYFESVKG